MIGPSAVDQMNRGAAGRAEKARFRELELKPMPNKEQARMFMEPIEGATGGHRKIICP